LIPAPLLAMRAKDGFTPPRLAVTGKLRHKKNIPVDDFLYIY
jgi:hypothetical protein